MPRLCPEHDPAYPALQTVLDPFPNPILVGYGCHEERSEGGNQGRNLDAIVVRPMARPFVFPVTATSLTGG